MKLRAVLSRVSFAQSLRALVPSITAPVADAAADALRNELASRADGALKISGTGVRRVVGSESAEDAAREFGTIEKAPQPWLAPALPTALEPMRAAAKSAVARAVSSLSARKK